MRSVRYPSCLWLSIVIALSRKALDKKASSLIDCGLPAILASLSAALFSPRGPSDCATLIRTVPSYAYPAFVNKRSTGYVHRYKFAHFSAACFVVGTYILPFVSVCGSHVRWFAPKNTREKEKRTTQRRDLPFNSRNKQGLRVEWSIGMILMLAVMSITTTARAAEAEDSINRVNIDLFNLTVDKSLPFDTWFTLHSQVPMEVKDVHAYIQEYAEQPLEGQTNGDEQPGACRPTVQAEACKNRVTENQYCKLESSLGIKNPDDSAKTRGFAATVPPLQPSRFYRLCFDIDRGLASGETESFAAVAVTAVDEQFWAFGSEFADLSALGAYDVANICTQMTNAIERAIGRTSGDKIKVIEDSPIYKCQNPRAFDAPPAELLAFVGGLADVRSKQTDIEDLFRTEIDRQQGELRSVLQQFVVTSDDDPKEVFVRRAISLLQEPDSAPDDILRAKGLVNTYKDVLPLLAMREEDAEAFARGESTSSPKGLSRYVRTVLEVEAATQTYDQFRSSLVKLLDFLLSNDLETLSNSIGVTLDPRSDDRVRYAVSIIDRLDAAADDLQNQLPLRRREIEKLRIPVAKVTEDSYDVFAQTHDAYATERTFHVSADAGFAYGWDVDSVVPYFGANFYLRPVNRNVPLRVLRSSRVMNWRHRWSITVGLTLKSIKEDDVRDDLFNNQALVLGIGWRLTDVVRLNGGVLVFKEEDPNPLIDDTELAVSPYFGISWDWDLQSTLQGFGNTFGSGG